MAIKTVSINPDQRVRLTHTEQLAHVKKFFQSLSPSEWGQGSVNYEGYDQALRQRSHKPHEANLRKQVRLKLR